MEHAAMQFCEPSGPAWPAQPGNTWSSLAYVVCGALILARGRGRGWLLGVSAVLVGLASAAFHGTNTRAGELADLGSMFLLSSYLVVEAWKHLGHGRSWVLYGVMVTAALGVTVQDVDLGDGLFGLQLGMAGVLEARARRSGRPRPSYRPAVLAAGSFAVAYGAWNLDYYRIVCSTTTPWLNGHALWHVLTAAGIWQLFRFYEG